MSTHERARLRSVKRLFDAVDAAAPTTMHSTGAHSTGTTLSAAHAEPCADDPPAVLPVGNERLEHFQVLLPAVQARHLRALADHERTIATDLIRQWVSERLAQQDIPHDHLDERDYPPNVIRLPYVR